MAVVVMKFGGTSVANIERIQNVARHVKREVDAGNQVAVVVSAMSGVTDARIALGRQAASRDAAGDGAFAALRDKHRELFSDASPGTIIPLETGNRAVFGYLRQKPGYKKAFAILGNGDVTVALDVTAHAFSSSAKAKLEGAGGSVTEL